MIAFAAYSMFTRLEASDYRHRYQRSPFKGLRAVKLDDVQVEELLL
jgi:hypothetical protein